MNFRNCCKTSSIITESRIREMIGDFFYERLIQEEKRCQNDAFEKIEEYNLSDVIDKNKIQMTIILLNEKAKNGYPLIMISKPWVSRDYAGNIFYANDEDERREVYFQSFFDDEKAYAFANQFCGLNSVKEVCDRYNELNLQQQY